MFLKKRNHDTIQHLYLTNFSLLTFILFLFILFFSPPVQGIQNKLIQNNRVEKILPIDSNNSFNKKAFQNLNILAKSYIIYDINTEQIIFAKNEKQILPLASLTKIASALTMSHLVSGSQEIIIKKKLIDRERKDSKRNLDIGLVENQRWQMSELLKFALVNSSNDSIDIIAKTISNKDSKIDFIKETNNYIKSLGFQNFIFNNSSGLDSPSGVGGQGNALEYAKLLAKSYQLIPEILSYTTNSKINLTTEKNKIYAISNTNISASQEIGLLASKTGFTDLAGGNLAVIFDLGLNRKIAIVVLGSTIESRFTDVNTLLQATKQSLINN